MNSFNVAKKMLSKRGWCKWVRHDEGTGKSCLLGAFEHSRDSVYTYFADEVPEAKILADIILEKFRDRLANVRYGDYIGEYDGAVPIIACFNNHTKTTIEDVNAVLDIAEKSVKDQS
jgi:hypothetical protein